MSMKKLLDRVMGPDHQAGDVWEWDDSKIDPSPKLPFGVTRIAQLYNKTSGCAILTCMEVPSIPDDAGNCPTDEVMALLKQVPKMVQWMRGFVRNGDYSNDLLQELIASFGTMFTEPPPVVKDGVVMCKDCGKNPAFIPDAPYPLCTNCIPF